MENQTVLQNNKLAADTFNEYFCYIVKNLYIPKRPCFEDQTSNLCGDRLKASIEKYKDHPSIICINSQI